MTDHGTRIEAARSLLARYVHRVDDGEFKAWSELFSDSAEFVAQGQKMVGREAIYAYISGRYKEGVPSTAWHFVTNLEIDVDGDDATVRSDFQYISGEDGIKILSIGRYYSTLTWSGDGYQFVRHDVQLLADQI